MPAGSRADLYGQLAQYYDQVYAWKEYRKESRMLRETIQRHGPPNPRTLVDVGCGTGEHLRYFRLWYECVGVDQSREMLRVARRKLPGTRLIRSTFGSFRLARPADVLTCLFSAIGYLRTDSELRAAFENFYRNLAPGGIALVEPWITPDAYRGRRPHLVTFVSPDLVLARVNLTRRRGNLTIMTMHYLIGDRRRVRYLTDRHVARMTPIPRLVALMRSAGFRVRFRSRGLPMGRGLLLGIRPRSAVLRAGTSGIPPTSSRGDSRSTGRT